MNYENYCVHCSDVVTEAKILVPMERSSWKMSTTEQKNLTKKAKNSIKALHGKVDQRTIESHEKCKNQYYRNSKKTSQPNNRKNVKTV